MATIQDRGGYLHSAGMDCEGIHVIYHDPDVAGRDVHLLFDREAHANEFIDREFPRPESSGVTYTGYGANTHAPCGN